MDTHSQAVINALARLLRPLVRILLRHGVSFGAFTDVAKRTYVEVAENDFPVTGRQQSTSRIAVLTGLHRREVARVRNLLPIEKDTVGESANRAVRVISGWLRDERYHDAKGDPDGLPLEGDRSFDELVKRYSGDIPPRAVADELLRVGAVELTAHRELRLTARGYIPSGSDVEKLLVLGIDARDLIDTVDYNLTHPSAQGRFQRSVTYDNVPVEQVEIFRMLSGRLAQNLLEHLNESLASRDRDNTPNVEGTGRARIGMGIYLIEEIIDAGEVPPESPNSRGKK